MSHRHFNFRLAGIALLVVVGLGLGYGASRWWKPAEVSPRTPVPPVPEPSQVAQGNTERPRTADPVPEGPTQAGGKRALLVGVTKYDHLPADRHLSGPANDVTLMRRLLQERYQFPAGSIVSLTEDEGSPDRRPTRANIEREFRRLAELTREGDQVVILLAGHGARQPEKQPPDPRYPEPDGIDEIFLPADVKAWTGFPDRVPNAIVDDEIRVWLEGITSKKAYVWAIFDCCHSGTMTRGTEVVRELPPDLLVPERELERARKRATGTEKTRGDAPPKPAPFVPPEPSDYLVAVYACRSHETTPESPQPQEAADARYHGLLSYSLVDILTKSASSRAPLTYRELIQRVQTRYAARPQGSPTPLVEGKGQDRVVLGTEQVVRSRLMLTREKEEYRVNAGDLYGLTPGSILAVDSPAGKEQEPKLLGHVRVRAARPFEATVEPCAHGDTPLVADLPPFSTCRPVFIDYGLRRFKVAVRVPENQAEVRERLRKLVAPLADANGGLVDLVTDVRQAEWLIQLDQGKVQLLEASGNAAPFALPALDSAEFSGALRQSLEKVYRARNLIGLSSRFEAERYRGNAPVSVDVEVLLHKNASARGEVTARPADGWVFRPGNFISFRVHNRSPAQRVDVTLLIIGSDFQINPFYPRAEEVGKSLNPGESLDTPPPPGEIGAEPPFGPESLVVIAVPAKNPPQDFTAFAQDGLPRTRAADRGGSLQSPLGELLAFAMYRSGSRSGLARSVAEQHGMQVLTWRTEPVKAGGP